LLIDGANKTIFFYKRIEFEKLCFCIRPEFW